MEGGICDLEQVKSLGPKSGLYNDINQNMALNKVIRRPGIFQETGVLISRCIRHSVYRNFSGHCSANSPQLVCALGLPIGFYI